MNIDFADQALADLEDIADRIAADNPVRASSFVAELVDRCRSLWPHPNRFPEVSQIGYRPIRKLTHGGYLIFYSVTPERIEIQRVVHGSRDWATLIFPLLF